MERTTKAFDADKTETVDKSSNEGFKKNLRDSIVVRLTRLSTVFDINIWMLLTFWNNVRFPLIYCLIGKQ